MFKSWMMLSTGYFIIHCIMQLDFLILNHGIAIYPVDSAMQLLNNLARLRIKFWAHLPTAQQDFSSTEKFSNLNLIFTLFIISFSFPYIIFLFGPWGKLFPTKETCIIKVVCYLFTAPSSSNFSATIKWKASAAIIAAVLAGLEIISRESPDMMTGQIHFSSVTYCFWPVQFYKINNSKNRGPWTKTGIISFQTSHCIELTAL